MPEPKTTSRFEVNLELRPRGPQDRVPPGVEQMLCASLWLWTHLGGIGARVRRGFGSMHVAGIEGAGAWPSSPGDLPRSHTALTNRLVEGIDWAASQFRDGLGALGVDTTTTGTDPHPQLRTLDGIESVPAVPFEPPDNAPGSVADAATSAASALDHAGRKLRDFRSTLRRRERRLDPLPDYFAVKEGLQRGKPPRAVGRAAFGLPLPFFFRSLGDKKTLFTPEGHDRMASPLVFRVHRLTRGRFAVALFDLSERASSGPLAGARLAQDGSGRIEAPDGSLIREFIAWATRPPRPTAAEDNR